MNRTKIRLPRKRLPKRAIITLQRQLDGLYDRILAELVGRKLPDPAEVIRQGREERDKQLLENIK